MCVTVCVGGWGGVCGVCVKCEGRGGGCGVCVCVCGVGEGAVCVCVVVGVWGAGCGGMVCVWWLRWLCGGGVARCGGCGRGG